MAKSFKLSLVTMRTKSRRTDELPLVPNMGFL